MRNCKFFAVILAAVIIFSGCFVVSAETEYQAISETYVNPIYTGVVTQKTLKSGNGAKSADEYYDTIEEAAEELREGLEERDSVITVGYVTSDKYNENWYSEIFYKALEHTGVPTQGDYIFFNLRKINEGNNILIKTQNNKNYISFTYDMEYLTTEKQEKAVDNAVELLLKELDLDDASDYEKVRAVYDYMCKNITYDYKGLEQENPLAYTAYAALINKRSVCQGYATLFYRLMLELNVDTRVISGVSFAQGHGWNIVKLDGVYYNLDSTWDATYKQLGLEYNYLLKSGSDFNDHARDEEFLAEQFNNKYPMAQTNYDICENYGHLYDGCNDLICNKCNKERKYGHEFTNFKADQTHHWEECACGQKANKEEHVYDNGSDTVCDVCDYERIIAQNGWNTENGKWVFYENGIKLKNQWKEDSVGWCYLGEDGYMKTDTWLMDSVGWCYIGSNGYCITNSWAKDSIGWIWLNSAGSMTKNSWIIDGGKWYWLDGNGYMSSDCWMKDSTGWVYLGSDGAMMTDAWVRDSVGWCFVGSNGYAVTNCWKQDSVGWCYLNSEGSMTKNSWLFDGGNWYYLNNSGYMVTGWNLISGTWYNFNSSGIWI